jgi:hypothetical protein
MNAPGFSPRVHPTPASLAPLTPASTEDVKPPVAVADASSVLVAALPSDSASGAVGVAALGGLALAGLAVGVAVVPPPLGDDDYKVVADVGMHVTVDDTIEIKTDDVIFDVRTDDVKPEVKFEVNEEPRHFQALAATPTSGSTPPPRPHTHGALVPVSPATVALSPWDRHLLPQPIATSTPKKDYGRMQFVIHNLQPRPQAGPLTLRFPSNHHQETDSHSPSSSSSYVPPSPSSSYDSSPSSPATEKTPSKDGATVRYTYESFMVADGRSKKRKMAEEEEEESDRRQRFACNDCGKVSSVNLLQADKCYTIILLITVKICYKENGFNKIL